MAPTGRCAMGIWVPAASSLFAEACFGTGGGGLRRHGGDPKRAAATAVSASALQKRPADAHNTLQRLMAESHMTFLRVIGR